MAQSRKAEKTSLSGRLLLVVSAPSGGGKTTLCDQLLRRDSQLIRSVSATTRLPRSGERHGRDYYFVDEAEFLEWRRKKKFLEWARVHDHYYGTLREEIDKKQRAGRDVVLVIDVQGGLAVKRRHPEAVLIFVRPPSFDVLAKRLRGRATDDPKTIRQRLRNARGELALAGRYDYCLVNDRLETAVDQMHAILTAERLRVRKQKS